MSIDLPTLQAVILDSIADSLKTLPFLFGAYLLMEFLEHHSSRKMTNALANLGPFGPIGGAVLGLVPQCGFSVAAANFYAGRLISSGTLLAVFMATSDEALPILMSRPEYFPDLLRLLGVKLVSALALGLAVDLALSRRRKASRGEPFQDLCQDCGCGEHGVLRSALTHTWKIAVFLLAVNFLLGLGFAVAGEERIAKLLLAGSAFQPMLTALLGFIPNCAASVILMELYIGGAISFGSAVAGLCTGAGLGLAVLFRVNRDMKENLRIVGILYAAAVLTGMVCQLAGL